MGRVPDAVGQLFSVPVTPDVFPSEDRGVSFDKVPFTFAC